MSEPFRHRLRVRYNECDPQGVVFNANYLTYFDLTMGELWRELGGYQAMVDAGVDMVVAEATIRYLAPLRFDDELELVARIRRLGDTSMTTELVIEDGGEPAAEGNSGTSSSRPAPVGLRRSRTRSGPVSPATRRGSAAQARAGASGRCSSAEASSSSGISRSSSSPAK